MSKGIKHVLTDHTLSYHPIINVSRYRSLPDSSRGDVMVVGGGISGIQASLDLATAGFKVYLVEKAPSIGGHMAQLDKTFPTNDCSM